jgi:hypothetical protein
MRLRSIFASALASLLTCGFLQAQTSAVTLKECEYGTRCVGNWTINGTTGTAAWDTGGTSELMVKRFDSSEVLILRYDVEHPAISAVYLGAVHGNRIEGDVVWKWVGQWNNKPLPGKWSATILSGTVPDGPSAAVRSAKQLPGVMYFCGTSCMTLKLDNNGHYVATADNGVKMRDGSAMTSTWTVEHFSPESVIFNRVDSNGFACIYAGQIAKEGNGVMNMTMNGKLAPALRLIWGPVPSWILGGSDGKDQGSAVAPQNGSEAQPQ